MKCDREVDRIYVYGPVPSRRLGYSLGVDLLPFKACSLDCIYCQLGSAGRTTCERGTFFDKETILEQIKSAVASGRVIDTITFSGSGEPTLSGLIGELIRDIKSLTAIPVTVLTNSTLLTRPEVRAELLAADRVVPSLDAVNQDVFENVNRPHPTLRIEEIIEGLKAFRSEFKGEIWLEIMLVKGVNDGLSHIRRLRDVIAELQPDRVQLNTVVRPPAEAAALPLSREELEDIQTIIGGTCEIVADFVRPTSSGPSSRLGEEILAMIGRRPVTLEDMRASLGIHRDELLKSLDKLVEKGKIRRVRHRNRVFYEPEVP